MSGGSAPAAAAYPYSSVDRLAEPHRYMYTPYHGRPFLAAYFADRTGMGASATGGPEVLREAVARALAVREEWGGTGTTGERLAACVRCLLAGREPGPELADHVRRYEVSKKLHRSYDPSTRKGSGGHQDMAPYLLLALACGLEGLRGGTLKHLNCLLKLGDLLVSRRGALAADELPLARAALSLEVLLVRQLMVASGLVPKAGEDEA